MEDLFVMMLLGLLAFLLAYHFQLHYISRYGKLINQIPGPKHLPFVGNLLQINVPVDQMFILFRGYATMYYPIYKTWYGNKAIVNIICPDDMEILLTSSKLLERDFPQEYLRPWLDTGLLTSSPKNWYVRRKMLTPAFHFNILKKYMDITHEEGDTAVKNVKFRGKEVNIDLFSFCSQYTLKIICGAAMGVSLDKNINKDSAKNYKKAMREMCSIIINRAKRPYIKDWMVRFMPKLRKEYDENFMHQNDLVHKIIKERREYHQKTNFKDLDELNEDGSSEDYLYIGKKKRLAMLDLLLAAERDGKIDDKGIKDEVATFVFAGHDTTSVAMSFTLMLLAENKFAQDKARKEIEEIFKRNGGIWKTSDLHEMPYLERCIKESLRLFPPVTMISRLITEDVQLKHYYLPKGCNVILHFYDMHRHSNFWPEPEKFDPDRFLPEQIRQRHPFSYLPFSAGPRNCIGQKFAMMEQKALISRILYNFQLEPIDYTRDVRIKIDIVIRCVKSPHTKFVTIDRK